MAMCPSRKRMHSVMTNAGFGEIIIHKDSFVIELPQTAVNQTSQQVKKFVQKQIDRLDQLTVGELLHLQSVYGMEVTIK